MKIISEQQGRVLITTTVAARDELLQRKRIIDSQMTEEERNIKQAEFEKSEEVLRSLGEKAGVVFIPLEEQIPDENGVVVTAYIDPQKIDNSFYDKLSQEEKDFLDDPSGLKKKSTLLNKRFLEIEEQMKSKRHTDFDTKVKKSKDISNIFYIISACWLCLILFIAWRNPPYDQDDLFYVLLVIFIPILLFGLLIFRKKLYSNWQHSKLFRIFCFGAVCWALLVIVYAALFDSDYFYYFRQINIIRILALICFPVAIIGTLTHIYHKYVK